MKRLTLALFAAALAACGTIPVADVPLPDITVEVPATFTSPVNVTTPVVYVKKNYFEGVQKSAFVNSVGIRGQAAYLSVTGAPAGVQTVNVFMRLNFDHLPSSCSDFGDYVVCGGDGESAQAVGSIDFTKGNPTAFTLGGDLLLQAARSGVGYFGLQLAGGRVTAGDQLRLTQLHAVAKF